VKHKGVFAQVYDKPQVNKKCVFYVLIGNGGIAMYKGKWDGNAWITEADKVAIPDNCVIGWMY